MADTQNTTQSADTRTATTATSITMSISRDAVDYDGKKAPTIGKTTVVEQFDYECLRSRNAMGATYGPTVKAVLHCTVKSETEGVCTRYYQHMSANSEKTYAFIFSNGKETVRTMYVSGYIVDIAEAFDTANTKQMLSTLTLLVTRIAYCKPGEEDKPCNLDVVTLQ